MNLRETIDSYPQVFIICDRNVEAFAHLLGDYPLLTVHASEATKTVETVVGICRWLLEKGADRGALVLAVGGGVTTDMVGFAASIYKRGIAYANIPTTLLSMVDAGLGGKTGVNLDSYKNMIGTFRQPVFTWLFPDILRSLPKREFLSGAAEMLKTFIIEDRNGGYERTVKLLRDYAATGVSPADTAAGLAELSALIQDASGIKQDIVDRDPLEKGERRVLNLGHTWGHAIEWWQRQGGEEVEVGEAGGVEACAAGEAGLGFGAAAEVGVAAEAGTAGEVGASEASAAKAGAAAGVAAKAGAAGEVGAAGGSGCEACAAAKAGAAEPRTAARLYTHGEAVAIGIICAAKKAEELGVAEPVTKGRTAAASCEAAGAGVRKPAGPQPVTQLLSEKLAADFAACGLPTALPCTEADLAAAIRRDKKAVSAATGAAASGPAATSPAAPGTTASGPAATSAAHPAVKVNFVLPVRIGKVVVKALEV